MMEEDCWYFYSKVYKAELSIGYLFFFLVTSRFLLVGLSEIDRGGVVCLIMFHVSGHVFPHSRPLHLKIYQKDKITY